jgi:TolB-like protein
VVKILDFGIAKLSEAALSQGRVLNINGEAATAIKLPSTNPGMIIGTANYMSPEQAKGKEIDARSDIFSFGIVLYEMLSGKRAFGGETPLEIISSILKDQPEPIRRLSPSLPREIERIVDKTLRKDRDERYQTARDLLTDLKDAKQELEFQDKLERTAAPNREEPKTPMMTALPTAQPQPATSSAEYITRGVKKHKRGVALGSIIVLALLGVGVWFFFLRSTSGAAPIDSIAVLPFVNESGDPNAEYLGDGITESIISSLSQLPQLRVMARSTAFRYKGKDVDPQKVGHDLGVRAVLMGRLIQQGENLTIRTELVNVSDGTQLWGQQYNRKLAEVFAVQEEIAQEISEKLRLKLSGSERQHRAKRPTENLKAFQYYIEGRTYIGRRTRKDLLTGVQYFERAIEEDPNYALAYAGLADAYDNLGARTYIAPMEGRRKAEENARNALALDENLAEAHAITGEVFSDFPPYDFALADRELHRAIELSPSLALAHQHLGGSLVRQGRLDEGLEEYRKARELDPLSPIIARAQALPYYLKRDYARALQLLRQANQLGPAFTGSWEIGAYIQSRSFDEAVTELENAKRERKDDPLLIHFLGMVYAAQRKHAEALGIIKELEGMSDAGLGQAHFIAKIYATMNEKELAFSWLERGLAVRAIAVFYKDEPVWDPIRSDPRFADLLRRMGIP